MNGQIRIRVIPLSNEDNINHRLDLLQQEGLSVVGFHISEGKGYVLVQPAIKPNDVKNLMEKITDKTRSKRIFCSRICYGKKRVKTRGF